MPLLSTGRLNPAITVFNFISAVLPQCELPLVDQRLVWHQVVIVESLVNSCVSLLLRLQEYFFCSDCYSVKHCQLFIYICQRKQKRLSVMSVVFLCAHACLCGLTKLTVCSFPLPSCRTAAREFSFSEEPIKKSRITTARLLFRWGSFFSCSPDVMTSFHVIHPQPVKAQ